MRRIFHPGSEWFYIRIYSGPETGEKWLAEVLPVLVEKLQNKGFIDSCFFIRYLDPQFHLRVRFHLIEDEFISEVLKSLMDASTYFLSSEIIWKTELGSYERELERYGEDWIEGAEEIFGFDTRFWLKIFPKLRSEGDAEEKRWKAALYNAHLIFGDFHIDIRDRISLLTVMAGSLFNEMGGGKKLQLILDKKFRENRVQLEKVLNNPDELGINGFKQAAEYRSREINTLGPENNPVTSSDLDRRLNFISDAIHMSLNRGFRSKHRMHELVIYSFLKQLYISFIARGK